MRQGDEGVEGWWLLPQQLPHLDPAHLPLYLAAPLFHLSLSIPPSLPLTLTHILSLFGTHKYPAPFCLDLHPVSALFPPVHIHPPLLKAPVLECSSQRLVIAQRLLNQGTGAAPSISPAYKQQLFYLTSTNRPTNHQLHLANTAASNGVRKRAAPL